MESKRPFSQKLWFAILILLLIGAIILTGRRKMLMTLSLFWVLQFFLLTVLRKGRSKIAVALLVIGLAGSAGIGAFSEGSESSLYLQRGTSVFGDVATRAGTSIDLFWSALNRSSGIGLGAGVASQGIRYSGANVGRYVGGSSESGIGFLAVELGIPGMLVIIWLIFNILRTLWGKLKLVAKIDDHALLYSASFAALLAANFATFMTATQLYGDFFVLIILGIIAGLMYASIYTARNKAALRMFLQQIKVSELSKVTTVAT